jgi:hypothetical protein
MNRKTIGLTTSLGQRLAGDQLADPTREADLADPAHCKRKPRKTRPWVGGVNRNLTSS